MHRASRYRLYPNRTQERQFARLCGAGRFVYNELLADQIREYGRFEAGEIERPGASEFDFGKRYTRLKAKEGNEWLRELSATVVRGTGAFPLGAAFAHFSRRWRNGKCGKQAGFPRFKARGRSRESFTIPEAVKIQKKRLWVPKVGWIRMNRKASSRTRGTDPWDGGEARARHYQWRASRRELMDLKNTAGEPVCTKSGKPVKEASNRRRRLQQRAAKAKRKAAEIRKDFSHQASADRARLFGHIVLEDLDVQAMRRSARGTKEKPGRCVKAKAGLNRKMAQFSCMGMVERFLQYKAMDIIRVPARNTSRTCAQCGHTEKDNRRTQAHFQCLACGHTDNADANAARNILNLGLEKLLAGGAPVTGRGEDNEAGAFFMECLVETANDPSTMSWNYRGSPPDFHT